jgi:formate hydrogenlyase subunit 3/multisubunit Na+/H+ antiporter MnhD subunit
MATASLLVSNRFLELYPLTPENLDLVRNAVLFLAWGLGLLLAVVPLHIWLSSLGDELTLLGTAFLVGIAQAVGVWLILGRMSDLSWLVEKTALLQALVTAGILTIPVGALLALAEKREARWLAYLSLVPLGHALIGLGLGTRLALEGALIAMMNRALAIALVAGGLTTARALPDRRWQRVAAIAILVGGFSLAAVPPTLGAVSALTIYRGLAVNWIGLLFISDAIVFLATIRMAWGPLGVAPRTGPPQPSDQPRVIPYLCAGILLFLGVAVIAFGIFPQALAEAIQNAFGKAGYLK